MKIEGLRKGHLIGSSLLYLFMIIGELGLIGDKYSGDLYVLSPFILLLMGVLFFVYYAAKKEEGIAKKLSVSNTVPFFLSLIGGQHEGVYSIPMFFVSLILLLFNLYVYWSREEGKPVPSDVF